MRSTLSGGLGGLLCNLSPLREAGRGRQNQCDHKACAFNLARWIKWPAVHSEPLARGMGGFSATMPLWETLKLHYPEIVS